MGRTEARETVFKLIYEMCMTNEISEFSLEIYTEEMSKDDKNYIHNVYFGVAKVREFLTGIVENYSKAFKIDRVYKVDLALMLVAAYEILYMDKIPFQVAANEAVELSKKYSTEKSYRFVNGVLSSVIKDKDKLLDSQNGENE